MHRVVRVRRGFERPERRRRRPQEDGAKAHHRRQPRAEVRERLHVVVADVEVRERPRLAVGPRDGERVQRTDPVVPRDEPAQLRAPRSMPSRETIALLVTSNVRRFRSTGNPSRRARRLLERLRSRSESPTP